MLPPTIKRAACFAMDLWELVADTPTTQAPSDTLSSSQRSSHSCDHSWNRRWDAEGDGPVLKRRRDSGLTHDGPYFMGDSLETGLHRFGRAIIV